MGKIIFLIAVVILGFVCMWIAIFGKKKDVKSAGTSIPTDFADVFFMILYRMFPSFLRRIVLFLLGAGGVVFAIYALIYLK